MGLKGFFKRSACVAMAAGAMTTGLILGRADHLSGAATSTPTVATWAEQPQTPPNYIFPFMSLTYFSVANISEFQYLMYRPLYWFGNGTTPGLNENLSLADQPAYTNNNSTLTINLKDYKWSNGETVTTQDVMFFLNMLHAEKANWAGVRPRWRQHPRLHQECDHRQPDPDDIAADDLGQHVLVHLQPVGPDHAVPDGLGHRPQPAALPDQAGAPRPHSARPTPPAPRSTPSCPTRRGTTRPTRRRPTTRCRPTPPTRSGRWSTGRGT